MKELLPAASLSGLREVVSELGGDFEGLAREAGIPAQLFDVRDGFVPHRKMLAFVNIAARVLKRPDIGLLWGARSDLLLLGPLSIAMMNAPTVRRTMELLGQHLPKANSVLKINLVPLPGRDDELVSLRNDMPRPPVVLHAMEHNVVYLMRFLRQVVGPRFRAAEIWMSHAQSGSNAAYVQALGALPAFEQRMTGIVIRKKDLDRRVTGRNSQLFEMAEGYLRDGGRAAPPASESRLVEAIRVLMGSGDYSIAMVSQVLGLHQRTIQRQLREAGVSFSRLKDDARRERAEILLATSGDSLTNIALTLGYADLAAFSHGCRRWFGMSPKEKRKRLQGLEPEERMSRMLPLVVAHRLRRKRNGE